MNATWVELENTALNEVLEYLRTHGTRFKTTMYCGIGANIRGATDMPLTRISGGKGVLVFIHNLEVKDLQ